MLQPGCAELPDRCGALCHLQQKERPCRQGLQLRGLGQRRVAEVAPNCRMLWALVEWAPAVAAVAMHPASALLLVATGAGSFAAVALDGGLGQVQKAHVYVLCNCRSWWAEMLLGELAVVVRPKQVQTHDLAM